jgi:hypothetical protein
MSPHFGGLVTVNPSGTGQRPRPRARLRGKPALRQFTIRTKLPSPVDNHDAGPSGRSRTVARSVRAPGLRIHCPRLLREGHPSSRRADAQHSADADPQRAKVCFHGSAFDRVWLRDGCVLGEGASLRPSGHGDDSEGQHRPDGCPPFAMTVEGRRHDVRLSQSAGKVAKAGLPARLEMQATPTPPPGCKSQSSVVFIFLHRDACAPFGPFTRLQPVRGERAGIRSDVLERARLIRLRGAVREARQRFPAWPGRSRRAGRRRTATRSRGGKGTGASPPLPER